MGSLPSVHRFYREDYPQSTDEFGRFLGQVNLFTDPVYLILNQGINLMANTTEELYTLQVSNASATGSDNMTLFTPKKFVGAPNGVIIAQVILLNVSTPTAIGSAVTLDWVWTGSQISILAIYGLTATKNYTFTLRIF